jgi:hypothetical protein
LVSLNPVKRSLEDYFVQKVGATAIEESRVEESES